MSQKILLLAALSSLSLCLTGCEKLLLIHLYDASSSAASERDFIKEEQQVCHGMVEAANSADRYVRIPVNSDVKAVDPQPINAREQLHRDCKKPGQPTAVLGTFACPAWQLAIDMSDRYSQYRPVVVTQIQTNEFEQFCP